MAEIGINVYWRFPNSDAEKCTFIMASSHESACNKVRAMKGSDIEIIGSQEYDRVERKPKGDRISYEN